MLPVRDGDRYKEPIVYQNAKYHCFVSEDEKDFRTQRYGKSLCRKHTQVLDYYETIESGQVLMFLAVACKSCFERWKKKFWIGS